MDGLDSERFKEFLTLLSGYFGSKAYIDTVNKDYKSADSLFFKKDSNGERERTQLRAAFDSARNASQSLCFAALDGVEFQALPSYFAPFAEYIKSPAEQHRISAYTIHFEETSYTVPKNLWLILNISETERLSGISDFVISHKLCRNFMTSYSCTFILETACIRCNSCIDTSGAMVCKLYAKLLCELIYKLTCSSCIGIKQKSFGIFDI